MAVTRNPRYRATKQINVYELVDRPSIQPGQTPLDHPELYLEERDIYESEDGKEYYPGVAKAVTMDLFESIGSVVINERMHLCSGPIPSNVLYADQNIGLNKYIVYFRGIPRDLRLGNDLPDGSYATPNMILMYSNGVLSAFAVKVPLNKMKHSTVLYRAPYTNIYENGTMCAGTVKVKQIVKQGTWEDMVRNMSTCFFDTRFSHSARSGDKMIKGSYKKLMKRMKNCDKFDNNVLVDTGLTYKDLY